MNVTLVREKGRQLGIKLGGRRTEPGIFIIEILEGSVAALDGRLRPHDRILAINDIDVRYARLDLALRLVQQTLATVSLIVYCGSRKNGHSYLPTQDSRFPRPQRDRMSVRSGSSSDSTGGGSDVGATGGSDGSTGGSEGSSSGGGSDRNSLCSNLDHGRTPSCESLSDHSHGSSMLSSPGDHPPHLGVEDCYNISHLAPNYQSSLDTDDSDHQSQQRLVIILFINFPKSKLMLLKLSDK